MSDKLIRVTGINYNHIYRNKNYNSYKVQPIEKIDGKSTRIQRQHQEVKDEFKRIYENEKKKR